MDNTKSDDILIEAVIPKIKELEDKLKNGEVLKGENVNFLLLCAIQSKFDDRFYPMLESLLISYETSKN